MTLASLHASAIVFNPRFTVYAHSLGMTPEQLVGKFAPWEFMAFIRRELLAYCKSIGRAELRLGDKADHEAFTEFLWCRYPEPKAVRP